MPHYRIYPLDAAGRIGMPIDADCPDDAAALFAARDLDERLRRGCEVWQLTRFLGRFHFHPQRGRAEREPPARPRAEPAEPVAGAGA